MGFLDRLLGREKKEGMPAEPPMREDMPPPATGGMTEPPPGSAGGMTEEPRTEGSEREQP
jgi:hypothetical protein